MKTFLVHAMARLSVLVFIPLSALAVMPVAAVQIASQHAPGMCLGAQDSVAAIYPCAARTEITFNGYGPIRLNDRCLASRNTNPATGGELVWEQCAPRRGGAERRGDGECRYAQRQCWGNLPELRNEEGFHVDLWNGSRAVGAAVRVSGATGNRAHRLWHSANLQTRQAIEQRLRLNPVGRAQLSHWSALADTKLADMMPKAANILSDQGGLIVAAGAGNFVTLPAGVVAAGAGNIVASGGGNVVASGGGNIVAAGAGNLINLNAAGLQFAGGISSYTTGLARLLANDGGGLLANDGGGLLANDGGGLRPVDPQRLLANDGGGLVARYLATQGSLVDLRAAAAGIVAAGAGNIVAGGAGNFIGNPAEFAASMLRGVTAMTGSRSLLGTPTLPANLSPEWLVFLTQVRPDIERVLRVYDDKVRLNQPISDNARNQARALRDEVTRIFASASAPNATDSARIRTMIAAVEAALNAPPPPVPPPPPAVPPTTPPAVAPPPSGVPAELRAGPCTDRWVSDAVARVLSRTAIGSGSTVGECNHSRYGSWNGYADLLARVTAIYTVCSDRWVSAAIWNTQNRAPNGSGNSGECQTARYNNGSWSDYAALEAAVRRTFALPATVVAPPPPPPPTQPVPPRAFFSPGSVNFGNVTVGTVSPTNGTVISVQATTASPLNLVAPPWTSMTHNCPSSATGSITCTIQLQCRPTATETLTSQLIAVIGDQRFTANIACTGVAAAAIAPPPPPPPPPPPSTAPAAPAPAGMTRPVTLRPRVAPGKCVQQGANGLEIATCNGGATQVFDWKQDGQFMASGRCMVIATANTRVRMGACSGMGQYWATQNNRTLRSAAPVTCLDVANGGTTDGTPVLGWDCQGSINQQFDVVPR